MEEKDKKTIHTLILVIVGMLCFTVIVLAFSVGVFVGQERAGFSFRWAENYHRNFGGPAKGIFGNFPSRDFINGHGIFGQVMKIDGNNLIIKGQDNMETTVIVSDKTTIVNNSGAIKLSNLKASNSVVVIGSPNEQGQIEAKFIRVLPYPGLLDLHHFNDINC